MQTKPVFSLLLSMSVPMMLSMLIQSLYNIVDSIYVSRLGTDALTAVSLAYPLQNAILSAAVGIGVGISSAISIHLGAGNREKADRAATLGIALTLIHCIFFIIAGLTISEPFLKLFTDNPKILNDASIYTEIVLCLSFGSLFQIAFEKIFQGIGEMKITMYLLIAGCVVNIILDPILIFGLLGFPALGVAGAAIATVIGQISALLLYIIPRAEWDPVFPRRPAGLSGPDSGWAEVSSGTRVSGRGARNPHLGPGGARQQKPLSGHHLHCRPHAHGVPYGWARRGLFNLAWRRHPRHRLRLWQHEGGTPTPGLPAAGRYGRVLCGRSGRRHLLICRASRICGRPFSFLVQLTIPSSSFHPDATHPHGHPACGPERYASPGVSAGASGRCADQCWIEAGSSPQSSGSCGRAGG